MVTSPYEWKSGTNNNKQIQTFPCECLSMFFARCNPTPCLFRQKHSLPVHVWLNRLDCIIFIYTDWVCRYTFICYLTYRDHILYFDKLYQENWCVNKLLECIHKVVYVVLLEKHECSKVLYWFLEKLLHVYVFMCVVMYIYMYIFFVV